MPVLFLRKGRSTARIRVVSAKRDAFGFIFFKFIKIILAIYQKRGYNDNQSEILNSGSDISSGNLYDKMELPSKTQSARLAGTY